MFDIYNIEMPFYPPRLPPLDVEKVGNPEKPKSNVYFTIFAGRKRYLECLFPYVIRLLSEHIITEVHIWDYTRDPSDAIYIQQFVEENKGFRYIKPTMGLPQWNEYYLYYINIGYNDNDIIVKCDDDIVYIDTDQMCRYLNEIKPDGLYYPNIVNNDVCAYIQSKYKVHNIFQDSEIYSGYNDDDSPLTKWVGGWYALYDKAYRVHNAFLSNKKKFRINAEPIFWQGRISINMFGGLYSTLKRYYQLFLVYGNNDDELFFSRNIYRHTTGKSVIVPFINVAHFSFKPQFGDRLDVEILHKYKELADLCK